MIAATGRLTAVKAYSIFLHLGLIPEVHYAALFSVANETAAKMSILSIALASAAVLWGIVQLLGIGPVGCWAALIMLFTSTAFTNVLWDGKTDLQPALFGIAAIYWTLRLHDGPRMPDALVAGAMAALAIAVKPTYAIVMPPLIAILLLSSVLRLPRRGEQLKAISASIGFMAIGGLIAMLPIVTKNWVLFGEPFAPFVYLRPGPGFPHTAEAWFSPKNMRWLLLTYPIALVFGKYSTQHGNLSALVLGFAPLALLGGFKELRQHRALVALTLGAVSGIVAWAAMRPSVMAPRYFLPALLALIPLAAFGVDRLWTLPGRRMLKTATIAGAAVFLLICIDRQNKLYRSTSPI